jgi:hypothetical protein
VTPRRQATLSFGLALVVPIVATQWASASLMPPERIVDLLRNERPLKKVHYSWPVPQAWLEGNNPSLSREYVRITGALSVRGENVSAKQLAGAVDICVSVQRGAAEVPAGLAINYSPWHGNAGGDRRRDDPRDDMPADLEHFVKRLMFIRDAIVQANAEHKSTVRVAAVLLDSERFKTKPMEREWNDAIREKHDVTYQQAKAIFPEARVIWYQFGGIQPAPVASGWIQSPIHDVRERHDCYACDLYHVPDTERTRETFRRTVAAARASGDAIVVPWVALASGYRPAFLTSWQWTFDWNYELVYSWQLGRELGNGWFAKQPERFAPWDAADAVVFYPGPGDRRSPNWWQHFVAYVYGSNGHDAVPKIE